MWVQDERVMISKGYMYLEDLKRSIDAVPIDSPLVIHCRIGTSGGYDERVTHPFCITDKVDLLHCLDVEAPVGIAHNGVLPYQSDDKAGISDTMRYIMDVVYPLSKRPDVVETGGLAVSKTAINTLRKTSRGSRLCVLDAFGHMTRIGKGWSTISPGVYASNRSWADTWYKWATHATAYDEDFYEGFYEDSSGLVDGCRLCDAYEDCKRWGAICNTPGELAEEWQSLYDAPTGYPATLIA